MSKPEKVRNRSLLDIGEGIEPKACPRREPTKMKNIRQKNGFAKVSVNNKLTLFSGLSYKTLRQ
jgi:hypothetical protein